MKRMDGDTGHGKFVESYGNLDQDYRQGVVESCGVDMKREVSEIQNFQLLNQFSPILQSVGEVMFGITQVASQLAKALTSPEVVAELSQAVEGIKRLQWLASADGNEAIYKSAVKLADFGWFVDEGISDTLEILLKFVPTANRQSCDKKLRKYYTENLDRIELSLKTENPERAGLFESAFEAHRAGKFELSIPVFLAQADGLMHKNFQIMLFSGKDDAKKQKIILNKQSLVLGPFSRLIASRLLISSSVKNNVQLGNTYNRNLILHGVDTKYATLDNSLKAISLVNFLAWFLPSLKAYLKET